MRGFGAHEVIRNSDSEMFNECLFQHKIELDVWEISTISIFLLIRLYHDANRNIFRLCVN